jgi:hypothetical protein
VGEYVESGACYVRVWVGSSNQHDAKQVGECAFGSAYGETRIAPHSGNSIIERCI